MKILTHNERCVITTRQEVYTCGMLLLIGYIINALIHVGG